MIFNNRNKAGSGEGEHVHISNNQPYHEDPFSGKVHTTPQPAHENPVAGYVHPLTAHLNKMDSERVASGGPSLKLNGEYGADHGALFRNKRGK